MTDEGKDPKETETPETAGPETVSGEAETGSGPAPAEQEEKPVETAAQEETGADVEPEVGKTEVSDTTVPVTAAEVRVEEQLINGKPRLTPEEAQEAGRRLSAIADNVEKVIIGKRETVELVITAMITGGHILLEDVPGVGKTSLVSAVAKSVDCGFKRIQFTPDLMPSDVTGFSIFNQKTGEFEFRPGGVMSNLVLADEINRASAKTQAALLEAMEEHQVTVDSNTYPLEPPFMVLATQNPVESFGTYPLPEAQVDRFLMKLQMGYPTVDEEVEVVDMPRRAKQELTAVVTKEDVLELAAMTERVYISPSLSRYIVEIVEATRSSAYTTLGASPRGSIYLHNTSCSYALMQGRDYVTPEDIKYLAPFILGHRMILTHDAKLDQKTGLDVVAEILESVMVPEMQEKK